MTRPNVTAVPSTGQLIIDTPDGNEEVVNLPVFPKAEPLPLIFVNAPGFGLAPARGDGVHDDTAALNAIIAAAQLNMIPILLPSGLYSISSPLLLCEPTATDVARGAVSDIQPGFMLGGTTSPSIQPSTTSGNMIQMTGTNQDAILQIGAGAVYASQINNISLDGNSPAHGTKYGIHTIVDHWSGISLMNTRIQNVDLAIWIDGAVGGGNGEFFNLYNCQFSGRSGCYKNTSPSGQALIHGVLMCAGGTENGGTQFWMNDGQLNVFSWSSTQGAGPLTNTFLRLDETLSGTCNFMGGRCEIVDTLISWRGGSAMQTGIVNIAGFNFAGMGGTKPFLSGGGTNCNYNFVIKRCSFGTNGNVDGPLIVDIGGGGYEMITFEDCTFAGWGGGYAQLTTNPHVTMIRCRWQDINGAMHAL